jgi:hypothetical protein
METHLSSTLRVQMTMNLRSVRVIARFRHRTRLQVRMWPVSLLAISVRRLLVRRGPRRGRKGLYSHRHLRSRSAALGSTRIRCALRSCRLGSGLRSGCMRSCRRRMSGSPSSGRGRRSRRRLARLDLHASVVVARGLADVSRIAATARLQAG